MVLVLAPSLSLAAATAPAKGVYIQRLVVQTYLLGPLDRESPYHSLVVVTRQDGQYRLSGLTWSRFKSSAFSGAVDAHKMMRLRAAMRTPLLPTFSFDAFDGHAAAVLEAVREYVHYRLTQGKLTTNQAVLLKSVAANPVRMAAAMTRSALHTASDDYPSIEVDVTLSNGKRLKAHTVSQHLFMLPWMIGKRGKTYDPVIARALYAILPDATILRGRLGNVFEKHGDTHDHSDILLGWRGDLAQMFRSGMGDKLAAIGVKDHAGNVLSQLRKHFTLADLQYWQDMHGEAGGHSGSLSVTLSLPGGPNDFYVSNFLVEMVDGHAKNLPADVRRAKYLFKTALNAPAVVAEVTAEPSRAYSISRLSNTVFLGAEDLGKALQKSTKPRFAARQLEAAVLVIGLDAGRMDVWIAFPDGHAVELHRTFAGAMQKSADCITRQRFQGLCISAVFAANGMREM